MNIAILTRPAIVPMAKILRLILIGIVCGGGWLFGAHGQAIVSLDLGNNALASNGTGFTKLGTAGGDYAANNGSYYLWTNVAGSGLSLSMTNIAKYGSTGTLDADGFYNISGQRHLGHDY